MRETNLHYRAGGSDKVYNVHLEFAQDGFVVYAQYARRGESLNTARKTDKPVSLIKAMNVFNSLVS